MEENLWSGLSQLPKKQLPTRIHLKVIIIELSYGEENDPKIDMNIDLFNYLARLNIPVNEPEATEDVPVDL